MKKKRVYNFLNKVALFLLRRYLVYENQISKSRTYIYERAIEYSFALEKLYENKILSVLDIGTGKNSFAATLRHCGFNVTASDIKTGYWKIFDNRHIYVVSDDITKTKFIDRSFEGITCISTLEHIANFNLAVKNMVKLLRDNGILILSFPYTYNVFCENIYKLRDADKISRKFNYIARSFSDREINDWVKKYGLTISDKRFFKGWTGKFWRTGDRMQFPIVVENKEYANGVCLLLSK